MICIALANQVYLWNETTEAAQLLFTLDTPTDFITSLAFSPDGDFLSAGDSKGQTHLFQLEFQEYRLILPDGPFSVSRLAWNSMFQLAVAYSNGTIYLYDIRNFRQRRFAAYAHLRRHQGRIQSLEWDPFDQHVLASGGDDFLVVLWDTIHRCAKRVLEEHSSAVRALAFCPWQKNILATGNLFTSSY